jgi:hypothetical protein
MTISGALNINMNFDKLCNSILERVYHGTAHDVVGNFSLNKIGTGEGNIAYGWGLYFAENPNVAQDYRKGLSHRHLLDKIREVYDELDSSDDAIEALKDAGLSEKEINLVQALQGDDFLGFDYPHQAVNAALKEPHNFELSDETKMAIANMGNLYQVNILADKENDFLQWDKPLNQQSEKVQNAVREATTDIWKSDVGSYDGSVIYNGLVEDLKTFDKNNPQKNASMRLFKAGVLGIRYLDQGSRDAGKGTYNYVIFDPSVIQIVSKNGEFVMSSKTPENVEV